MNVRPVTEDIAIAGQPSSADLQALREEGYSGVVNLRNDGEPEQLLSTADEGAQVRSLGMDYLHYGVGGRPLDAAGVQAVCDFIDQHAGSGKVLVHCYKGGRAAALVLLHQARAQGWSPDEIFDRSAALGITLDPGLKMLVQRYLDTQS